MGHAARFLGTREDVLSELVAAITTVFTAGGTLQGTAALIAVPSVTAFAPTGSLNAIAQLVSVVSATAFSAAGTLIGAGVLAATPSATAFGTAGNLKGTGNLVATPSATAFTTTGTLTGTSETQVALSAHYLYGIGTYSVEPANATFSLQATGQARSSTSDGAGGQDIVDTPGEWLLTGVNSDYEARAVIVSGTLTSGNTTWLPLSTSRAWTKTKPSTPIGTIACTITVEIRRVSDGVVLDSANVVLEAEV